MLELLSLPSGFTSLGMIAVVVVVANVKTIIVAE
jgi:hypothetical protein